MLVCSHCGAPLSQFDVTCPRCGTRLRFGGSSGLADEPGALAHETHPVGAQRRATTDTGGREPDGLEPAGADLATPMHRVSPAAHKEPGMTMPATPEAASLTTRRTGIPASGGHVSFSDPGDGYDSAIRWHADFERGDL